MAIPLPVGPPGAAGAARSGAGVERAAATRTIDNWKNTLDTKVNFGFRPGRLCLKS